jgi:hypothetical protein
MVISPRITIQSLEKSIGKHEALRSCVPIDFYMLLSGAGYVSELSPADFMKDLDRQKFSTDFEKPGDWSRPAITKYLRQKYQANIVSWQLGGPAEIDNMKKAGYLDNQTEIDFFLEEVEGRDLANLVRDGYPVITTMKPGFGTTENKNIHAVILVRWQHGKVTVIDPDARNSGYIFDERRVRQFIAPKGAGSIVLPRN